MDSLTPDETCMVPPKRHFFLLLSLLVYLFLTLPASARDIPYTATLVNHDVPDVTLTNQDGKDVKLRSLLLDTKIPVLVDFVYTTCTTICPVLSANFTNFQKQLAGQAGTFRLVSISIDPENDTPAAMKAYLERYHADPGWSFLTGSRADINTVLIAFEANTQSKMDHYPLILIKSPADDRWLRIYGLIGTSELIKEYKGLRK